MVKNSTNINKIKESLNIDGQQFHQYQQNKPHTSTHHITMTYKYIQITTKNPEQK